MYYVFYILLLVLPNLTFSSKIKEVEISDFSFSILKERSRLGIGLAKVVIITEEEQKLRESIVNVKDIIYSYLHVSRSLNLMKDNYVQNLKNDILQELQERFSEKVIKDISLSFA